MSVRPVLWAVVALGAATIVTASVLTSREKPKKQKVAEDDEGCCGGGQVTIRPAVETIGRPDAPVKVVGFVPDNTDHDGVIRMLRQLAGNHADAVQVTLRSEGTAKAEQEMQKLGHKGSGFFVNGRKRYRLPGADGTSRDVVFEGKPGKKYKPSDLKAAIQQAMAGATGTGTASDAVPAQAGEDAGTDARPQGKAG